MSKGFTVTQNIPHPPAKVWSYLTDFSNAPQWMPGVQHMEQTSSGPLVWGSILTFKARGRDYLTKVISYEQERNIALTSTQGGVTATYTYELTPNGKGTLMTLNAVCEAKGFVWSLLHPFINYAMKKTDSSQLANIKKAMGPPAA